MKRGITFIFLFAIIILSSSIFVSASLWDKITGNVVSDSCIDSDGGVNYYRVGETTGPAYPNKDKIGTIVDHCFNNTLLNEGGCDEDGWTGWYSYNCPEGCLNGACVVTCTDSDGGINYSISGKINGLNDNFEYTENEDHCCEICDGFHPVSKSDNLFEWTCENNVVSGFVWEHCPNGCLNGACIEIKSASSLNLSLVPFHEDTSILIKIDINEAEKEANGSLSQLGFDFVKKNGIFEEDLGKNYERFIRFPTTKLQYEITASDLESDTSYEICLNGMMDKTYTSTGLFACQTIKTEKAKTAKALILKNYDVDSESDKLIDDWLKEINSKDSDIILEQKELKRGMTIMEIYNLLSKKYMSSNLRYVVFIGRDLPIPLINSSLTGPSYSVDPYQSLSFDVTNKDNGFVNPQSSLKEVSISVIRPKNDAQMQSYFTRLISYYRGENTYNKKLIFADGMTPSDSSLDIKDFIGPRYPEFNVEYIGGINSYDNSSEAQNFQNNFKHSLSKNYELIILNTHGSRDFHYPCTEAGCINSPFIESTNPDFLAMFAISCSIGYFMEDNSPLNSYLFSGNSLVGAGAPVPIIDINGGIAKNAYDSFVNKNKSIGDSFMKYGLTIIGDPFIKLDLSSVPDNNESEQEELKNEQEETKGDCQGCLLGGDCIPYTVRIKEKYCGLDGNMTNQRSSEEHCDNNFECSSNLCIDGKCVSSGLWQKFLKWIGRLFG